MPKSLSQVQAEFLGLYAKHVARPRIEAEIQIIRETARILMLRDRSIGKVYNLGSYLRSYEAILDLRDLGFEVPALAVNAERPPFKFGRGDSLKSIVESEFPEVARDLGTIAPKIPPHDFYLTKFMEAVHYARADMELPPDLIKLPAMVQLYERAKAAFGLETVGRQHS